MFLPCPESDAAKRFGTRAQVTAWLLCVLCAGSQAQVEPDLQSLLTSAELRSHPALLTIGAQHAYRLGLSGKGTRIAIIDSGLDARHPDIAPNLLEQSIDIVPGRSSLHGASAHGLSMAILAAGAFNGQGSMGVAHGAGLLVIRADNAAACGKACEFRSAEIAAAIDYAVQQRAHIINLSLVGTQPPKPVVLKALRRAAAQELIIVVAGGNDKRYGRPSYPARYASAEGLAGLLVVAGHHDDQGLRPRNANGAKGVVDYFLRAPGAASSHAAAYVSGALALLREACPAHSPRQLVQALLDGAREAGARGPDQDYGRGLLDVGGALRSANCASS